MRLFPWSGRRGPIPPSLPAGLRVYAIGDVHGRLDLLDRLLAALREDHERRTTVDRVEVVLLGDLIDRGDGSAGVVRRAMAGLPWATLRTLMGNHEEVMLDALDGDRAKLKDWLRMGGRAALASWGVDRRLLGEADLDGVVDAARAAVPAAERAWLAGLPSDLRRGDYLFVHAGVRPGVPLDRQSRADLLWIREAFLSSSRHHGAMIVHGHSIESEPVELPNRIGIDTGAWRSGRLTALGLDGRQRWLLAT